MDKKETVYWPPYIVLYFILKLEFYFHKFGNLVKLYKIKKKL